MAGADDNNIDKVLEIKVSYNIIVVVIRVLPGLHTPKINLFFINEDSLDTIETTQFNSHTFYIIGFC
jgi:hypothetical protein